MKKLSSVAVLLVLFSIAIFMSGCGDAVQRNGEEPLNHGSGFGLSQNFATARPNTFINSHPTDPSNSTDATFTYSCDKKRCSYKCKLDAGVWAKCPKSGKTYSGLSEGAHTFMVKAKNLANDLWDKTPASYSWTIDTSIPDTVISSGPSNPTFSTDASFVFSCTGAPCSSFECQMDGSGFTACSSPANYSGLSEGAHTFEVRAKNASGTPDPSPASYSWTIDQTPPETVITSNPANPSNSEDASFSFTCNDLTVCVFQCQLDGGGFSSCASPKTYSGLSIGEHTFMVFAIDQLGHIDSTPATYSWTIDLGLGTWTAISTTNAPSARRDHTAVWTGSEMIIWGGCSGPVDADCDTYYNTGGRYDPITNSWVPTDTTDPDTPLGRFVHSAVWASGINKMIIWGGADLVLPAGYNDGGLYEPTTNSWSKTNPTNAPVFRGGHTAVWTGSEMIIWGGRDFTSVLNTGGRYNPSTDSWMPVSTTNAPSGRWKHTAVWTGSRMIVWGGCGVDPENCTFLNTGGKYNPSDDSWSATSTTNAPSARAMHTAVWDGNDSIMIIWGGEVQYGSTSYQLNTGGKYKPGDDSWTATSTTNAPSPRAMHTALWTGTRMLIWGGWGDWPQSPGGRYNPLTNSWTYMSITNAPSIRAGHTAVWTGTEMIIWGGEGQTGDLNTGAKYIP